MAKLRNIGNRLGGLPPRFAPERVACARTEIRGKTAERGYGGKWQRESVEFRRRYPHCAYCWLAGRRGPAELVDHLYPHGLRRGAQSLEQSRLFWLKDYWVSTCHQCHGHFKPRVESDGIEAIDNLARRLGLEPIADPVLRDVTAAALAVARG